MDGTFDFYEDALSEDEECILCGAHNVKGSQDTTVYYWWPKPSVWAASGFNLGYWPGIAEEWFIHRREEI
jgi:hypothetical protein